MLERREADDCLPIELSERGLVTGDLLLFLLPASSSFSLLSSSAPLFSSLDVFPLNEVIAIIWCVWVRAGEPVSRRAGERVSG